MGSSVDVIPNWVGDLGESVGPVDYGCVRRCRHRRLATYLCLHGFRDALRGLLNETDAYMSVIHLSRLVQQGLWDEAIGYVSRFLRPVTDPQSDEAQAALQSILSDCPAPRSLVLKHVNGLQRIRVCSCCSLILLGVWHYMQVDEITVEDAPCVERFLGNMRLNAAITVTGAPKLTAFGYAVTGSVKTHTMLGEISELGVKPRSECGMAPRIFQFLIARIRTEEESRRDENLKYNCKCSFLEIYNEQITDLLDPSSTNLQLREDTRLGVYVENLTKREVTCVSDIITLLMVL
ncbi:hypothetical protein ZWY2020_039098 [Hordeum vulgare]|nr:hypothetical protein ZWY2020_039098 [Hordeum vulgare]